MRKIIKYFSLIVLSASFYNCYAPTIPIYGNDEDYYWCAQCKSAYGDGESHQQKHVNEGSRQQAIVKAIIHNNPLTIELLKKSFLSYRTNLSFKNAEDETPLHIAIKQRKMAIIKLLLALDVNLIDIPNAKKVTPIDIAVGIPEILELFMKVAFIPKEIKNKCVIQ